MRESNMIPHEEIGVPLLNDSEDYALGAEFGMLFAAMEFTNEINGWFKIANQEQITLLANRYGWHIISMKRSRRRKKWFRLHMVETRKAPK